MLTNELIRRFDQMDVKSIYVQGRPVVVEGGATLETVLENLEHRFEKVRTDPLMSKVFDIYTAYIKRTMGADGGTKS